jgi:hypothetical protein
VDEPWKRRMKRGRNYTIQGVSEENAGGKRKESSKEEEPYGFPQKGWKGYRKGKIMNSS